MFAAIAIGLYAAVAALAAIAAMTAPASPRGSLAQSPRVHWYGVALVMILLTLWRLTDGEAVVQALGRGIAHAEGRYEARRDVQGPIVLAAVFIVAAAAYGVRRLHAPAPEMRWSRLAVGGLLAYSAVRALSYHPVDALIYAAWGPFHVNHLIDIGLLTAIAAASVLAIRRHHAIRRKSGATKRGA